MICRYAGTLLAFLGFADMAQAEVSVKRPFVTGYLNSQCELATDQISAKRFKDAQLGENIGGCLTFIDKQGEKFYVRESALESPSRVVCTPTQQASKVIGGGQAAGAGENAKCPK